jgi:putative phosphoesterase
MKLLIIGDSHGNISNLKHVLGFGKHIKVSAVIHTGDWNNVKSLDTVFNYNIPIYTVQGNADIDPKLIRKLKIYSKKFSEDFLKFKIGGVKIGVVHKLNNNKDKLLKLDIIFSGHYHSQVTKKYKDIRGNYFNIVQPGALENGINFAVFDTKTKMVEFINDDELRKTS